MLRDFDWETESGMWNKLGEMMRSLLDMLSLRCSEIPGEWDLAVGSEAQMRGLGWRQKMESLYGWQL